MAASTGSGKLAYAFCSPLLVEEQLGYRRGKEPRVYSCTYEGVGETSAFTIKSLSFLQGEQLCRLGRRTIWTTKEESRPPGG